MTYLKANTSSPVERAMVAAENACRVPLIRSDGDISRGRTDNYDGAMFRVMGFCKEAMTALEQVSEYDHLTFDLVREKIGRAQVRVGLQ